MNKSICIAGVILLSNECWALTFMGPPSTSIKQGEIVMGFEYSQANTRLEIDIPPRTQFDMDMDAYLGRAAFGIADGAEVSVRFGISDIEDMGNEGAWGLGAKVSLAGTKELDLGLLFQMASFYGDETDSVGGITIAGDYQAYEYQVAIGPTVRMEGLTAYGGPFYNRVDGDIDLVVAGIPLSFDVEEDEQVGLYGGLRLHFDEQTSLSVEYQTTMDGDTDAFGISILVRFGK